MCVILSHLVCDGFLGRSRKLIHSLTIQHLFKRSFLHLDITASDLKTTCDALILFSVCLFNAIFRCSCCCFVFDNYPKLTYNSLKIRSEKYNIFLFWKTTTLYPIYDILYSAKNYVVDIRRHSFIHLFASVVPSIVS